MQVDSGSTDVVVIELKNREKLNALSNDQNNYLRTDGLHDHYQPVEKKNKEFLAITDKPISPFNFATNGNPNYWLNKLQSQGKFLNAC